MNSKRREAEILSRTRAKYAREFEELFYAEGGGKDEGGGRWITIGANASKDGGPKKGGARVYVKDGKIEKGPGKMIGNSPGNPLGGQAGKRAGELDFGKEWKSEVKADEKKRRKEKKDAKETKKEKAAEEKAKEREAAKKQNRYDRQNRKDAERVQREHRQKKEQAKQGRMKASQEAQKTGRDAIRKMNEGLKSDVLSPEEMSRSKPEMMAGHARDEFRQLEHDMARAEDYSNDSPEAIKRMAAPRLKAIQDKAESAVLELRKIETETADRKAKHAERWKQKQAGVDSAVSDMEARASGSVGSLVGKARKEGANTVRDVKGANTWAVSSGKRGEWRGQIGGGNALGPFTSAKKAAAAVQSLSAAYPELMKSESVEQFQKTLKAMDKEERNTAFMVFRKLGA